MKTRAPSAAKRWGAQTDPGAAAGDDGNFVFNLSVHKRFLFRLWFVLFVISTASGCSATKLSIHLAWSLRLMAVL
jgi:hypothetical protein